MQRHGGDPSQECAGCLPEDAGTAGAKSGWSVEVELIGITLRSLTKSIRRVRAYLKPEVRQWLDGFGVFFAITLFFCLIAAAHDEIINRERMFDSQRWWYPIYRAFNPASYSRCTSIAKVNGEKAC